jgi:hypothetical protein
MRCRQARLSGRLSFHFALGEFLEFCQTDYLVRVSLFDFARYAALKSAIVDCSPVDIKTSKPLCFDVCAQL